MNISGSELSQEIIRKAKALGADLAGIAAVPSLRTSPSHAIYPKIGLGLELPWNRVAKEDLPGPVDWPEDALSAVVIGVAHDPAQPELDWWDGKGTPGNRILIRINRELAAWIESSFSIRTYKLPYFVEKGGVFLKDAAVLAGLGSIGKNNLVITPGHGPRIRFRALLLAREVEPTGPRDFDPCQECPEPCRKVCPQSAFGESVYPSQDLGQEALPGRNGTYDRVSCNVKMEKDINEAIHKMKLGDQEIRAALRAAVEFEEDPRMRALDLEDNTYQVRYCRRCELACPVGR